MGIIYEGSSTVVKETNVSAIETNYPGTVNSGDILICQILSFNWGYASNTGGFSTINSGGTNGSAYLAGLWKRAIGSESGTFTVNMAFTCLPVMAIVHRFSGCISEGTPWTEVDPDVGDSATPLLAAITTEVDNSVAVGLAMHENDGTYSGETGFTEQWQDSTTLGNDISGGMWTELYPSAGLTDSDVLTQTSIREWRTIVFDLLPEELITFIPNLTIY